METIFPAAAAAIVPCAKHAGVPILNKQMIRMTITIKGMSNGYVMAIVERQLNKNHHKMSVRHRINPIIGLV